MDHPLKTDSAAVRERLTHPVIDGDGHMIEYLPVLLRYLGEVGGPKLRERFVARLPAGTRNYDGGIDRIGGREGWYGLSRQERQDKRVMRPGFWANPTARTLDRATVTIPQLFRNRLDDLGIDFAIVYPTTGFEFVRESAEEEFRRMGCRAYNTMASEMYAAHKTRMTPAACIPAHTPQEALDELEYAVKKLGMKAVVLGTTVRRPIPEVARRSPELAMYATWMDVLAHGSEYDYDPVWKKCVDLGVAVASHSGSMGFGFRTSPQSFVYNHIGHFAEAGEAFCKAVVLGGVARRFPQLRFAFLEGGVGWACSLYNSLIEHWEKRNINALRELLDPALIDRGLLSELMHAHGGALFERELQGGNGAPIDTMPRNEDAADLDEFKALEIDDEHAFASIFANFFFGCEADDRMTSAAFNPKLNHFGTKLQAVFSSDVGHFDVPDITEVLAEAYELVEDELLTEDDFRDFTFANAVKLYTSQNPDFFKGTAIEDAAGAIYKPAANRA